MGGGKSSGGGGGDSGSASSSAAATNNFGLQLPSGPGLMVALGIGAVVLLAVVFMFTNRK